MAVKEKKKQCYEKELVIIIVPQIGKTNENVFPGGHY